MDRLLAEGHTVVGIDNFDPFYPRAVKEANIASARQTPRFTLIEADIRDNAVLGTALYKSAAAGGFDAIVHLAAKVGVRPSIDDPVGYQMTNLIGTQNMLEIARRLGVKQFVFASSSSVYGVNPRVPWREDDSGLMPISPYASSKIAGELLGHVYSHLHGIRFIALRFFTVYGPRQRPDLAIHKFTRLMLEGKPIPFYGDGSTRRDYTYVDDLVQGVLSAIRYTATPYEVINLGNNHTVSLAELVAALEEVLERRAYLDRRPTQPGDVPQTWANLTKAGASLAYAPGTTISGGLGSFAKWLKECR